MRCANNRVIGLSVVWALGCTLFSQEAYDKVNSHLGMSVSAPLNPTAKFVQHEWGASGGAGYNFNSHHSVIFEFTWNRLSATARALQSLPAAAQAQNISGRGDLYAWTGHYRFELHGKELGAYFIGGGGLYHRTTNLSEPVMPSTSATCTPALLWWGFSCISGTLTTDLEIASASSTAFGVNGGVGFTARVGEAPYRFYVESRYHYAPTKNFSTQIVIVSFGIRY